MKIREKIFLGILLICGVGLYFLVDWIVDDLTPRYRESTEEPLVDTSRMLASFAAASIKNGSLDLNLFRNAFNDVYSRTFSAKIYEFQKTNVDFRVYITDRLGVVVFDSDAGRDEGEDYSRWRDVKQTLAGEYGARTSRDIPGEPKASVLYVASPIIVADELVGVLTVAKPTRNANLLIDRAKRKIIIGGSITFLTLIAVGLLVSGMISKPLQKLKEYAEAIKEGERVSLPKLGGGEIASLGIAFEEMRDALEGKQYVENYVQTLTHEVKSPISAIQGAAELMKEEMPEERKNQFLENIQSETKRIKAVVDKLLLLSSLENRKVVQDVESINLSSLIEEILLSFKPQFEARKVKLSKEICTEASIKGELSLIQYAIRNLIQNALEFSPEGSTVSVEAKELEGVFKIIVKDQGPGVPDYALERVFERFYSLKRPDTGKKSSGLGLSLVREVAALHGGSAQVINLEPHGVQASISFPAVSE